MAKLNWKKSLVNETISNPLAYNPSEISYRYINPKEDKCSSIYIVSPLQTKSGKAYVNAIGLCSYVGIDSQENILPIKTINLENEHLKKLIDISHGISDLVISIDSLLDKRQLENVNIEVVRYERDKINGRNIITSSTSVLSHINKILADSVSGLISGPYDAASVLDKINKDALQLSGSIMLRAARSYNFTYEMLGLILSKKILDEKFKNETEGTRQVVVYFMLDDYASWFPSGDKSISDILAIGISKENNRYHLSIKIVESKFISSARSEHKKKSYGQLKSTINTFIKAYYDDGECLVDKRQWHARLAELILDTKIKNIEDFDILNEARQAILEGNFDLSISGASFIFDHSQDSVIELGLDIVSSEVKLPNNYNEYINAHQVEFGRERVLELFHAYVNNLSIDSIFADFDDEELKNLLLENKVRNVSIKFDESDLFISNINSKIDVSKDLSVNTSPIYEKVIAINAGQPFRHDNNQITKCVETAIKKESLIKCEGMRVESSNKDELLINGEAIDAKGLAVIKNLHRDQERSTDIDKRVKSFRTTNGQWPHHIASLIEKYANNEKSIEEKQKKEKEANELADKLCRALRSYNFIAKKLHVRSTPNGVAVTLQGNDSLTVDKILQKKTVLLTSHAISISAVIPKPGKIIINIQNDNREIVRLWDIWSKRKINKDKNGVNTSFILAEQENEDALLYLNLSDKTFENLPSHDPHTLIAGTSGSGKSVLLRTLILDIAATNSRKDVKLILIDPKGGAEFNPFNCLPHMLMNTITTKEESVKALQNLIVEMDNRYIRFAEKSVTKLVDYNALCTDESEKLPYIFVVHDEFAEWMMDKEEYKDIVRDTVSRLGVKARAAGIFLIFAAQRPDSTVFPLQLRENLGNRLVLKVTNAATSDIATGVAKAHCESLMGNGHMIARLQNENILCQTPYIDDSEFREALEAIRLDNI